MPLSPELLEQAIWIEKVVNGNGTKEDQGLDTRKEWVDKETAKQSKIDEIRVQLNRVKETIRKGQEFSVQVKRNGLLGKMGMTKEVNAFDQSWRREKSDESVQFDTVHHGGKITEALDKDTLKDLMNAQGEVAELQRQMQESGLFSPQEIDEELWDSLVREELIPENAVPDSHSRMSKMWKESLKLYDKRLEEFTIAQGPHGNFLSKLDDADFLIENLGNLTDIGMQLGGQGSGKAHDIFKGIQLTLKAGVSVTKAYLKGDILNGFNSFPDAVGAIVQAATGNKDLAGLVAGGCKVGIKLDVFAFKLAKAAKDGNKDLILDALGDLADGVQTSLVMVGEVEKIQTEDKSGDKNDNEKEGKEKLEMWTKVSETAGQLIKAPAVLARVGIAIKNRKASDAYGAVRGAVVEAMGSVVEFELPKNPNETDSQRETRVENIKKGMEQATELDEEVKVLSGEDKEKKEKPPTPEELAKKYKLDPKDPMILKLIEMEQKKQAEAKRLREEEKEEANKEQTGAEIDEELRENRVSYSKQLAAAFAMDVEPGDEMTADTIREMNSIEALLAQMETDRAILKTAEAIFGGGVAIAQELFPPFKIVGATKEFIKNVVAAVERGIEMNRYLDVLGNSKKAHNVYGEAWVNRVQQSRIQMSKNMLDALIYLTQAIGAGLACGGLTSGAGIAIEKAAVAGKIAGDVLYASYNRGKLEIAWAKLIEARENPGDRILQREALWGNPTLSKYAVAYGATEVGDAMARQGLRHAGLTSENLADADPGLVVKYLEMRFADNPKLLRATRKVKWQPKTVELTVTSWSTNRNEALTTGQLLRRDDGLIDQAFAAMELSRTKYQEEPEKTPETADEYIKALEAANQALHAYKPLAAPEGDGKAEPHQDMQAYVDQLMDLCDKDLDTAREDLETLKFMKTLVKAQDKKKQTTVQNPKAGAIIILNRYATAVASVAIGVKNDASFNYLNNATTTGPVSKIVTKCEEEIPKAAEMKEPIESFKEKLVDFRAKLKDFRKKNPLNSKGEESSDGRKALPTLCADLRLSMTGLSRRLTAEAEKLV